jgi:outer membrane receptor protein involved in Fe transport
MKTMFLLLLCSFSFCFISNAQAPITASIKGTAIDSLSKKGQDYITAALKKDNETVKTALTNADGTFELKKVAPGKYTLILVAMGYNSKTIPVEVKENKVYDLGKIILASQSNKLNEVSVTAAKPIIKQEIDRITYDMQADPESKVNSVLDMMRKIPLLSVDAEDNIKLKGSGSYKILINGKPSSLVARNPSDVFKSMPAANIEKIEVITTPPAKYDSEGLAGLINIITKKNIDAGYNGSLNFRQGFPAGGPGVSGSLTVKQGKLGISAYGGYSRYQNPATVSRSSRTTSGDVPTILNQDGTNSYKSKFGYISTELSYEIDTLNLITAEFSFNRSIDRSFSEQNSDLSALSGTSQQYSPIQQYRLLSDGDGVWKGTDLSVNYQLGFKSNKSRLLTFSYKLSNFNNSSLSDLHILNRFNYAEADFPNYNQNNDGTTQEQTIQADYVHPITKKLNLEGGAKAILRHNGSQFGTANQTPSGEYAIDSARTNDYDNHQNVYGLYNSYQYNLENWGFKAGVRLELTTINADFISQDANLDKSFLNVIPAISVNRKFKDMSSLNFGYTQRIERPGIWELNPFVDRSNPNFESTGNPDLKPVLNNSFELNYSKFKKGSINVGLNYSFANNTVQQISIYNEETKITRTSYVNTGKDRKLGTNLNINYPFTPKLNFTLGGNMNYIWLQGLINGLEYKNDGLQGYFYGYLSYKLEPGWRIGGNFSYSSAYITLQGQSTSNLYTSFSVGKDIIKDKLTFSGSVSNPFQKLRSFENTTEGVNFRQTSYNENYFRRFNMSLNWRFGKLKESIKKNQRGISNDDVKSGGSSSSK